MIKRKKITTSQQRVAAELLTGFMFVKDMDELRKVWDDFYGSYELQDDPFTGCPCSIEDYCKNEIEYKKQCMIEKYGHCDGLE